MTPSSLQKIQDSTFQLEWELLLIQKKRCNMTIQLFLLPMHSSIQVFSYFCTVIAMEKAVVHSNTELLRGLVERTSYDYMTPFTFRRNESFILYKMIEFYDHEKFGSIFSYSNTRKHMSKLDVKSSDVLYVCVGL